MLPEHTAMDTASWGDAGIEKEGGLGKFVGVMDATALSESSWVVWAVARQAKSRQRSGSGNIQRSALSNTRAPAIAVSHSSPVVALDLFFTSVHLMHSCVK